MIFQVSSKQAGMSTNFTVVDSWQKKKFLRFTLKQSLINSEEIVYKLQYNLNIKAEFSRVFLI